MNDLRLGDCLEVLKTIESNTVDALVTDPPYGWRFMGKAWDAPDISVLLKRKNQEEKDRGANPRINAAIAAGEYDLSLSANKKFQQWTEAWAREVFRILKPGAHALVFCGPRTYHRMASGLEDAGFEIRDQLQWLFGSGFPKSLNLEKAGAGEKWHGWGTALKPANEPICLARKPISEKTVAANVLKWGVGGLNIDGTRIVTDWSSDPTRRGWQGRNLSSKSNISFVDNNKEMSQPNNLGRFPANLVFSHSPYCTDSQCDIECAIKRLDEQSGKLAPQGGRKKKDCPSVMFAGGSKDSSFFGDTGGASRFFYCAKVSPSERNAGCERLPEVFRPNGNKWTDQDYRVSRGERPPSAESGPKKNHHPTVKPQKLMRYLCRLITPPNGTVLDPFMGSGSTGLAAKSEGFKFIGIEKEKEYFEIAKARYGPDTAGCSDVGSDKASTASEREDVS